MAPLFNLMSKKVKRVKMEEKSGKEKKSRDQNLSNMRNEELKDYIYTYFKANFNICTYN